MARRAGRRRLSVFSLSFLDVMSCGFGAVVLIFLIIHHRTEHEATARDRELLAESRKLDYLIEQGEANLAELRERFEDAKRRVGTAGRQLLAEIDHRDRSKKALGELLERTVAERESVEALKADVAGRDKEVKRLQDEEEALRGFRVREIKGEGDRQYLTGLFVGGTHILVALDASASMLDRTIVQILRRRNMSKERQRAAPNASWSGFARKRRLRATFRSRCMARRRGSRLATTAGGPARTPRRSATPWRPSPKWCPPAAPAWRR